MLFFLLPQALPAPANGSPNKKDQKQAAADSKARSLLQRWAKVRTLGVLGMLCGAARWPAMRHGVCAAEVQPMRLLGCAGAPAHPSRAHMLPSGPPHGCALRVCTS